MNTITLERPENAQGSKRRLAKKVKRREVMVASVAFQRHQAHVTKFLRARYAQGAPLEQGAELTDDVLVFDRLGQRVPRQITPIDQLARFQKS